MKAADSRLGPSTQRPGKPQRVSLAHTCLVLALLLTAPCVNRAEDGASSGAQTNATLVPLPQTQVPPTAASDSTTSSPNPTNSAAPSVEPRNPTDLGQEQRGSEEVSGRVRIARELRRAQRYPEATSAYVAVLSGQAPVQLQQTVLEEMAQMAQEQNDFPRAQQIYSQYVDRWPRASGVPDILLRQGALYREMGLYKQAISKYYSVLGSALMLKTDNIEHYQRLVLRAQSAIAQSQFDLGDYAEAAQSLTRLLHLENPPPDRSEVQYRLVRCLAALGQHQDSIAQAEDFLRRYPDAPQRAEVHFVCATSLRQTGQGSDAFREVLTLLREEHTHGAQSSENLAYWQRRAGNEVGNRFYQDGEFLKALEIYQSLAVLDTSAEWQLPVWYQMGLVLERVQQTGKAAEYYRKISARERDLPADAPLGLKAVVEMAKWRQDFLGWQLRTERASLEFRAVISPPAGTNTSGL